MKKGTYLQAARVFFEETRKILIKTSELTEDGTLLFQEDTGRLTMTPYMSRLHKDYISSVDARMRAEVGWTFEEYCGSQPPQEDTKEFRRMMKEILVDSN